ncbi:putative head protein [Sinorhizobium phage HMSP1-Susan]|nr:putative head protein [Sinorhizobium phage HMSP1-Susan]
MLTHDGFMNVVTALGTRADKASHDTYGMDIPYPGEADNAFQSSTWFRKIVEIPVEDALKKNWTWKADEAIAEKLEKEQQRLGLLTKLRDALIMARKDGGAVIYIGGLPGAPDTPVNINQITTGAIKYLIVGNRLTFQAAEIDNDVDSPNFGKPKMWNFRDLKVHPSRVMRFVGKENMRLSAQVVADGFGDSIYSTMRKAILNADKTSAAISHLMDEAKVDVVSIPNLTENVSTAQYEQQLLKRLQAANMFKSLTNMLVIDSGDGDGEGEEYTQKQVSFAGIPDILKIQLAVLSGAADIPATRLIGKAPDGMNATGDGDMRNYYDKIEAHQKLDLSPVLDPFFEIFIRSTLGSRPADIWYKWEPLYTLTEKEAAEVEKIYADTFDKLVNTGIIETGILSAVAKNRMVESGQYPGIEKAMDEFETEDLPIDDPDDVDADLLAPLPRPNMSRQQAADAAPRSLYIRRDVLNKQDLIDWAIAQGFQREQIMDDLHVTLMYSTQAVDWMKVREPWSDELKIGAGGPRMVDMFGAYHVLLFNSSEMSWRHEDIKREAGAIHGFPDYSPHVSISKTGGPDIATITPYSGVIMLGPEIFEEIRG